MGGIIKIVGEFFGGELGLVKGFVWRIVIFLRFYVNIYMCIFDSIGFVFGGFCDLEKVLIYWFVLVFLFYRCENRLERENDFIDIKVMVELVMVFLKFKDYFFVFSFGVMK